MSDRVVKKQSASYRVGGPILCRCEFNKSTVTKLNLSLYLLYYVEAYNEIAGPIFASLRPGNTVSFEEMLKRWRAAVNIMSDLTGPRFEIQTSCSRDERMSARPTGRCKSKISCDHIEFVFFLLEKFNRLNLINPLAVSETTFS